MHSYKKGARLLKKWKSEGAKILKWFKVHQIGAKTGGVVQVQSYQKDEKLQERGTKLNFFLQGY